MKKVAYLCYDNPFAKPMEGGKRGILARIAALSKCDVDLDIYIQTKPEETSIDNNVDAWSSDHCHILQYKMKKATPSMLFSQYPICSQKRFTPEMVFDLTKRHYDVALYEGEQMMCYRTNNVVFADKHILYLLDIESKYRWQMAVSETKAFRKILQLVEGLKFKTFENKMRDLFDEFLFISIDELNELESKIGKCTYSAYSTTEISDKIIGKSCSNMLYIGDLSLENNFKSLYWFCENVLPKIVTHQKDVKLIIIGRIGAENKRLLLKLDSAPFITVYGYVDDLNLAYESSSFVISPVLYGAGVKAKVIDAIGCGQLVVGTKKAIEGTLLEQGVHVLVSDDPSELASICLRIIQDRDSFLHIAKQGHEYVKEEHSIDAHSSVLAECIGCSKE